MDVGTKEGRAVTVTAYRHLTFSLPSTTMTKITARNSHYVENNLNKRYPTRRADAVLKSHFLYPSGAAFPTSSLVFDGILILLVAADLFPSHSSDDHYSSCIGSQCGELILLVKRNTELRS